MMNFKIMYRKGKLQENRGAVAIVTALALFALAGITALSVDIGYGMIARTELQNVADGAALAGTRQLGMIYEGLTVQEQINYTLGGGDQGLIVNRVQTIALQNQAGGIPIAIPGADVQIGTWDYTTKAFTPTTSFPIAVRVTARRDGSANGPIVTFVAGIMGIPTLNVTATATASLGGLATAAVGDVNVPIGISEYFWYQGGTPCHEDIVFHPTNDPASCVGWHTFEDKPANANRLRNIIDGLDVGSYESPEVIVGVTSFEYIGGDVASAFSNFETYFNHNQTYAPDGDICPGPNNCMPGQVVVYERSDCSNPNKRMVVTGFASVMITDVIGPPEKTIAGKVYCDTVAGGKSGGSNFGLFGSIPGLVE